MRVDTLELEDLVLDELSVTSMRDAVALPETGASSGSSSSSSSSCCGSSSCCDSCGGGDGGSTGGDGGAACYGPRVPVG